MLCGTLYFVDGFVLIYGGNHMSQQDAVFLEFSCGHTNR